jgi:hypothetical protein
MKLQEIGKIFLNMKILYAIEKVYFNNKGKKIIEKKENLNPEKNLI